MTIGVYLGRFQPFHSGHAKVIDHLLKQVDCLYIVIGSANRSYEPRNPFTLEERWLMIDGYIFENYPSSTNIGIVALADTVRDNEWMVEFARVVPSCDIIFTNNPNTRQLFEKFNFNVQSVPDFEMGAHSGTNIRNQMLSDSWWRTLVPPSTAGVIDNIHGVKRVRRLCAKDL